MTSKLTSRVVCTHNPNKGEFEFGGVSVKGCCGKVRWNTVRQGDIWINGLFSEDEFLTSNRNPINLQTALESCTNEHSEVDWISKEIAYQELMCNDRSSHWSDSNNGKNDIVKEEHDMDIISTLTAVAALFRDWCAFETDLSQPLVNESNEKLSTLEKGNSEEWIWINDTEAEASKAVDKMTNMPMQNDLLNWSHYDLAWDDFMKERLKSQQMLYHAFFHHGFAAKEVKSVSRWFPDVADIQEDSHGCEEHIGIDWCVGSRAEEELPSFKHSLQQNRGTTECQSTCTDDQFGKGSRAESDVELAINVEPFVHMGLQDQYATFGSQHPATSRYSFGRESDTGFLSELGEMFPTSVILEDQPGNSHFCERVSDLTEAAHSGIWFGSKSAEGLLSPMLEEKKFNGCNVGEVSLLEKEASYEMDVNNESQDEGNDVFSMHEAMTYAFSYMSLQDLLTMEKVCKFLRDWIRNDVLLWQQLHVEPPINKSFTDEVLLELASRSKGQLRCLNLVDCMKVTEVAVEQVVFSNPRLTKLSIPGCTRISADSVMRMVEMLANNGHSGLSGLKQLRIRNIYGLTKEHLASLENMVGARSAYQRKPQYYHNGHHASFCDDERPIDVEECPKCTNVRLVYDCTRERCQQKQGLKVQECRACFLCTVRCEECGRCINDNDYEETFSLDLLCSCCWLRLPKCAACSRPGCGRHADHFIRTPETTYVCGDCCGTSSDERGPEFHVHG